MNGDKPYWHGAHNQLEHRTVGAHRAWCHTCTMWCYPGVPASDNNCYCCLEEAGYENDPARKENAMSDQNEVYLVTVTARFDQGCGGVFTNLDVAVEHCRAQWAVSDGHHEFRIDKMRLDEPIDNSSLLRHHPERAVTIADADDHIWITEDTE